MQVLELHGVLGADAFPHFGRLVTQFGPRVQVAAEMGHLRDFGTADVPSHRKPCDFALVSSVSQQFSIERLITLTEGTTHVTVVWLALTCAGEAVPRWCDMLIEQWDRSLLAQRGYCFQTVCMSLVPTEELEDPTTAPLDCAEIWRSRSAAEPRTWSSNSSEFGQD